MKYNSENIVLSREKQRISAVSADHEQKKPAKTLLNILLIALCALMAAGLAFYAYQAYQWKNVALEAISLNQKFVETNNELLDIMEAQNG